MYTPKKGDTILVSHPNGIFSDNIKGPQKSDTYKVIETGLTDCFGDIKIVSTTRNTESIVEQNWFNERSIKII